MRTPRVIPADTDPIVVPVTRDDFLRAPADSRCAPADAPPLTDDPRDVRSEGRMSAHHGPDEKVF